MVGFVKSALNLFGINKKDEETGTLSNTSSLDEFLERLPSEMGIQVKFVRVDKNDRVLHYEVEGEERDSFVGQGSEVLDALSHISMRVFRRSQGLSNTPASEGGPGLRIVFDAAGFRERKVLELKELAETQRQKVIDSGGKPSYVPALGPSERKIIHTHLAELGEVISESIGKGTFKRIRIRLKDDSPYRKPQESRQESSQSSRSGKRNHRVRNRKDENKQNGRKLSFQSNSNHLDLSFSDGNRQSSHFEEIDENIGNRLAPGEEPLFNFNKPNSNNS